MSSLSRVSSDQKLIEMWLHGRTKNTESAYRRDINTFFDFLDKALPNCTLEDLQDYSTYLDAQNIKPSTKRRKLNALKSLYTFATKLNYTRFNVAAALRIPKSNQALAGRILKQIDILKLIQAAKPGRDRTLLKLMYATGMRVSEICSLCWENFTERDSGDVQVSILGKGEKLRTVLVPATAWIEVEALRGESRLEDRVFTSVRSKPLDRSMAHKIIKQASEVAGINPKVSAHWLRHAHASHALALRSFYWLGARHSRT
jgi:integrase/recombinase XerD